MAAGAALALGAAFLAGALAAFLAEAFLTPAAFLAGVFFLVAVVVFLVLGAAFLAGVFFLVAVVGFLVEACTQSSGSEHSFPSLFSSHSSDHCLTIVCKLLENNSALSSQNLKTANASVDAKLPRDIARNDMQQDLSCRTKLTFAFLTAAPFLAMALGLAATPFAFGLAAEAFLALGLAAAGAAASPSALVSALVSAFGLAGAFLAAVFLAAGFFALVAVAFLAACRRQMGMLVQAGVRIESSRTVKQAGSRKDRELEGRSTRKSRDSLPTGFFFGAFFRASPSL